jgi:hypothetical protein
VENCAARTAHRASKSQSKVPAGGASFDPATFGVALAAKIMALAELKGALAGLNVQFPSACRVPEQGSGLGGCGNASGENYAVRQSGLHELIVCRGSGNSRPGEEDTVRRSGLPELIACRGTGNSSPGEKDGVRRSGLPEITAELAQSEADPGGSEETYLSYFWFSSKVCAPYLDEAAMTSSGTAQDAAAAALESSSLVT